MSLNKYSRKNNPLKPQRNFKNYLKFLSIAVIMLVLIDFVIFKGERPYITKIKKDYYAEQALKEKALEEALPPKVIFPEDGSEYFEAPKEKQELGLKENQSLLPEKQLNVTKLISPEEEMFEEVIEDATKEPLPKKAPRKKFTDGKYKIAIVIDDVGMNLKQSRAAINLPAEVTLALLPYADKVKEMAKNGRAKGHELIIHTPMEPLNKDVSLGSLALYSDMEASAFKSEFNKIANSFDGYVGINNHMGSKLTQDVTAMERVMAELKKRNLYFLDSRTIASSIAAETARKKGIPYAVRDVFLDHEDTPEFLSKALKKTEHIARDHGSAIVIGHPKQVTMTALQKWIPTLQGKGFELVPLSTLIHGNKAKKTSAKKRVKKIAKETTGKSLQKIEPAAGEFVGNLTPEDEQVIIKPLSLQNDETGSFIVRQPTKEIIEKTNSLPVISYPVD